MKKLTILSAIIILNSFAAGPLGAFSRPEDHVVIKGNIIKSMINFPVSNIRVYSVKDRKITLIPFQIDKVDIDGKYVLTDKEAKEKAAARKEIYQEALSGGNVSKENLARLEREAKWTENMNSLDAGDDLVFMAWDLGSRAERSMLPNAKTVEEIAITNPVDRDTAYVYAALFEKDPPALSPQMYTRYNPKNDSLETDFFSVIFDRENPFRFIECRNKNENGTWGPNFIDQMKMRFRINIKYFFTLNFDEGNSNGELLACKAGPVRVIKRLKFWIELLYIKVTPSVEMDFVYYTNGFISPAQINIPFDPQKTMNNDSRFIIGQDFNNNYTGAKVYTAKTAVPVTFDGKMTDAEKNLNLSGQNWYVVYHEGRMGFFTQMVLDKRLALVKTDIFYIDDDNVLLKPENEPGQHMVAFSSGLKQFPKGSYAMNIFTYMDKNWTKGKEKRYLDFIDYPLQARAAEVR